VRRPDQIPPAFRAHFARHNRQALLLAALALVVSLAFWLLLFFVIYWITLLGLTIAHGIDAQMPRSFKLAFAGSALLLCLLSLLTQKTDHAARDKKSILEVMGDFVFAVPRATLAAWGNLRAYQFLNEAEMQLAWRVVEKLGRERRIPASEIGGEIAAPGPREKVITALQIVQLVEIWKTDDGFVLKLSNEKARALAAPKIRLTV
jgi:hypothetical protein